MSSDPGALWPRTPEPIIVATDQAAETLCYVVVLRDDQLDRIADRVIERLTGVMALDKDGRLKTAPPEPEGPEPFQPKDCNAVVPGR